MTAKVFISYCAKDGSRFANQLRDFLWKQGIDPWLYHHDKTPGSRTWEEIAGEIKQRILVAVVTRGTISSYGQKEEFNIAMNFCRPIIPFVYDKVPMPDLLAGRNRIDFTDTNVDSKLHEVQRAICKATEEPAATPSAANIGNLPTSVINEIRELRQRTNGLDMNRVKSCEGQIIGEYLDATLPRQIAGVVQQPTTVGGTFQQIGFRERIGLSAFNDRSYEWKPYFADIGRGIARGERKYLHETVVAQSGSAQTYLKRSSPQFSVISDEARRLADSGSPPSILLAPVQFEVDLVKFFGDKIAWLQGGRRYLSVTKDLKLRVYWSNKYAPLDHFAVLSCEAITWHVIPDEDSGNAITVAIGVSSLYPDRVEYVAETVAWCEIVKPSAISLVGIED